MLEEYRYIDKKKLRCGYTTGSCAAAAALAAARMLLGGGRVEQVELRTPGGILLRLAIEQIETGKDYVSCAVKKDAGDDPDVTDGILIYARLEKLPDGIELLGGAGIGRVTRPGLNQPVGEAAINSVPRQMIMQAVEEAMECFGYTGGLRVTVSAPEGEALAKKTFNPRLGIEGGISILGTSGIVEPMSEAALLETVYLELRQRKEEGVRCLLLTPGNYGKDFIAGSGLPNPESCVKCSNYIGRTLDKACELGFREILLIGHIGKLVKLGAGVMNTHSRVADARMETLASCVLLAGGGAELAGEMLSCVATDEALDRLKRADMLARTMEQLIRRIEFHVSHRLTEGVKAGILVFSNQHGLLCRTAEAEELLKSITERGNGEIR